MSCIWCFLTYAVELYIDLSIQFDINEPEITLENLISKYTTHVSAHVQACYCANQANNSNAVESSQNTDLQKQNKSYVNRLWLSQARYVATAPSDLVIFLTRVFMNPITGFTQKINRQVTIHSESLKLSVILNDINDKTLDTNPNIEASEQFNNENSTNIEYTLVGTAEHTGDPKAGHYTNNIRNDNPNPQNKWVATNNDRVEYHDDFIRLSTNLIACWFTKK